MLIDGVQGAKPWTYDMENMEWAGAFIMNSITEQLYNDVSSIIGLYPKGPEALAASLERVANAKLLFWHNQEKHTSAGGNPTLGGRQADHLFSKIGAVNFRLMNFRTAGESQMLAPLIDSNVTAQNQMLIE